jgi:hypothetical protein
MSALLGIALTSGLIWVVWVGYVRVLASKKYSERQDRAPNLNRFADGFQDSTRVVEPEV